MKKFLIALALGIALVFALASVASADNGPHGGFNGSTNACASCHRAHSAVSNDGFLLVAADVYALCTSCHDGTGAYTNVVDGFFDTQVGKPGKAAFAADVNQGEAGLGLFGGGFVNARMLTDYGNSPTANPTTNVGAANINSSATAWARMNAFDINQALPAGRPVTSSHHVGQDAVTTGTVWGSGNIQTAVTTAPFGAGTLQVECTSCHDPHGNAGKQGGLTTGVPIPSYRLLRFTPTGSNGFEAPTYVVANGTARLYWDRPSIAGALVPDVATKWYTPNTDFAFDPSVAAYRGVNTGATGLGNEMFVSLIAGLGDYGGKYYAYRRPAATASASAALSGGRPISCPNGAPGTGVPTSPTTACAASVNTAANPNFNNLPAQDVAGFWCATCHDRYLAPGGSNGVPSAGPLGGSRDTDSTDPGYHYRHRSQGVTGTVTIAGVITNGAYAGTGQYTCLSCHNSHGTTAQADALGASATYAADSALLKGDNRAICTRCHAAPVNFFNTTTSPTAIMVTPP